MSVMVSILIPVYNCRMWVAHAIESARQQTWQNKEIIVIDDCSTDGSWEVLQSFATDVRVERASHNGGQNVTRNRLTELSRGEWLVYLDADDEMALDCIEKKMEFASDADAIYGTMEESWFLGSKKTRSTVRIAEEYLDQLVAAFWWCFPNTSSFMFRKAVVDKAGGWNTEIKNCTDYDLYFRLLLRGARFHSAPKSRTLYRHWSILQAIYEKPERLGSTRLQLMWSAARELESISALNAERRAAFEQAVFGVIRLLYPLEPENARREHARLMEWNPNFSPVARGFSLRYRVAYKLVGFELAEHLARFTRPLNPFGRSQLGFDSSGKNSQINSTGSGLL
jgi:glycosyltransferase involved in cell wall biosynthesis